MKFIYLDVTTCILTNLPIIVDKYTYYLYIGLLMKISDIITEYITAYHGAEEHGERRIGHTGQNSSTFSSYTSTRYGVFLSDNPEYSEQYGEVRPYAIGVPLNSIPDLYDSNVVNQFADWAVENGHKDIIFFLKNSFNVTWELFEDEIGKLFYQFTQDLGIRALKFNESLPVGDDHSISGTTYVVFDISILKRDPDPRQPDLFLQ